MVKNLKKHLTFTTILFSLLLISSFHSSLTPPVYALNTNTKEETVTVLNDVFSITTQDYEINSFSEESTDYRSLPKKETNFKLVSEQSKIRVKCSFVNNILHQVYFSDFEGKFSDEKPVADTIEAAQSLLINYQNYVTDSFYGELASMLDDVDATKNTIKSNGNVKLEVSNFEQTEVDYTWTYVDENGVIAKSKKVFLSYQKGRLKVFRNDWPLYTVVGTPKISGEEATAIAIEASKTFSYEVCIDNSTSTVTGFEIAQESLGNEVLSYVNNPNQTLARGGDPFTLYPSWYVSLGFEKSYPGAVTGMIARVWADTGTVSSTDPVVLYIPPITSSDEESSIISSDEEASTNSSNEEVIKDKVNPDSMLLTVSVAITAILSVFGISLANKKRLYNITHRRKLFSRLSGILMCLTLFSIIVIATPIVNAGPNPNSVSRMYAALDGDPNHPPEGSPPQLNAEKAAANNMIDELKPYFEYAGYTAYDMAGAGTTKDNILSNAAADESTYDRVVIFHFGHQAWENSAYVDNYGNTTWASQIDSATDTKRNEFVFIFVCAQAQNTEDWSMAAAWTNRTAQGDLLEDDGYHTPDLEGQCYIGFDYFSPMISLANGTFLEEITGPFTNFVEYFYYHSLYDCYTVNNALDNACLDYFGVDFDSSILYTGYNAWWPGNNEEEEIEFPFPLNVSGWYPKQFYPENPTNKMKVFGDGSMSLAQPTLTLTAGTGGSVNPPGTTRYTYGYTAPIAALPNQDYDFYEWRLNGQHYSYNQFEYILMDDDYSLQAVFAYNPPPPPSHYLTIEIWGYLPPWTLLDQGTDYLPEGVYPITAPANYGPLSFYAWYYEGNYYYDPTITIYLYSDKQAAVLYM